MGGEGGKGQGNVGGGESPTVRPRNRRKKCQEKRGGQGNGREPFARLLFGLSVVDQGKKPEEEETDGGQHLGE